MNEVFRPLSVGDQVKFLLFNEDEVVTLTCTGVSDEIATFTYDEFKSLYQKYDKDEEATYKISHYVIKDGENHGYPITFESVNIDKEGEICLIWKDHKATLILRSID